MNITVITDKTLIIPEDAPILLKTELLKAECYWQDIKQEQQSFTALGAADFHIAYLTLGSEQIKDIDYERILQMLDEAACEPQLPHTRHFLHIKSPLELCGELPAEEKITGLQLSNLEHRIISPRALEISMEFSIEAQHECAATENISRKHPAKDCESADCADIREDKNEAEQPKEKTICCPKCSENTASPAIKDSGHKKEEECLPQAEQTKEIPHISPRFRKSMNRSEKSTNSYCMKFYRVREGDSLWSIAEKMQVGAAQISELNHLEDGTIHTGMLLAIPR